MRRLLGRANSSNVMKVICLLEDLGLPYTREDIGGKFGGTDTPEYRAMNPNGIVPTLVEDEFVLWESNAILRYLASANCHDNPIWPEDLRARASIDRWMDWQQTALGPTMTIVFWGMVRTAPEKRDMAAIHAAIAKLGTIYGIMEKILQKQPFIAGPEMTLADISIGVHAHRWFSFDIERPPQPALRAWYDRLLARPAFAKHIAVLPLT